MSPIQKTAGGKGEWAWNALKSLVTGEVGKTVGGGAAGLAAGHLINQKFEPNPLKPNQILVPQYGGLDQAQLGWSAGLGALFGNRRSRNFLVGGLLRGKSRTLTDYGRKIVGVPMITATAFTAPQIVDRAGTVSVRGAYGALDMQDAISKGKQTIDQVSKNITETLDGTPAPRGNPEGGTPGILKTLTNTSDNLQNISRLLNDKTEGLHKSVGDTGTFIREFVNGDPETARAMANAGARLADPMWQATAAAAIGVPWLGWQLHKSMKARTEEAKKEKIRDRTLKAMEQIAANVPEMKTASQKQAGPISWIIKKLSEDSGRRAAAGAALGAAGEYKLTEGSEPPSRIMSILMGAMTGGFIGHNPKKMLFNDMATTAKTLSAASAGIAAPRGMDWLLKSNEGKGIENKTKALELERLKKTPISGTVPAAAAPNVSVSNAPAVDSGAAKILGGSLLGAGALYAISNFLKSKQKQEPTIIQQAAAPTSADGSPMPPPTPGGSSSGGGTLRVTLPTRRPTDQETQVEIPLDRIGLSNALMNKIKRDTKRRLRTESDARTHRIIPALNAPIPV